MVGDIEEYYLNNLFKKISIICSMVVGVIGIAVIVGWIFDIVFLKSVLPNFFTMKANAAVAFILTSISLLLLQSDKKYRTMIARIIALIILLIGLLTFIEHVAGYDFKIDQLLFRETVHASLSYVPGRMAPVTSFAFVLVGICLLLINTNCGVIAYQILAIFIGLFGLSILAGLTYYVHSTEQIIQYVYAAIHAAINFVLISIAMMFIKPSEGIARLISSNTVGGQVSRLFIPIVMVVSLLLGYIRIWFQRKELYSTETGVLFLLIENIAVSIFFILIISFMLMRSDLKRKELEKDLIHSNDELQKFAYIASHDLQEPLRMVSSYTQLLEKRYHDKLDQDAKDFLHYASDGAHRMQLLIDNLLDYSRVMTKGNEFDETDCNVVLKNVLDSLQVLIKEKEANITFDKLPIIKADEIQISRVFQNLINNAIKFCNVKPNIHIGVKEKPQEWIFSIKDNGIGIEKKDYEKLFIVFNRLNPKVEYLGAGMGLAICKRIIERHHGRIWVESAIGDGSTFYFTIPRGS